MFQKHFANSEVVPRFSQLPSAPQAFDARSHFTANVLILQVNDGRRPHSFHRAGGKSHAKYGSAPLKDRVVEQRLAESRSEGSSR